MHGDDLIRRTRAVVATRDVDPAKHGLVRLSGGMTNDVFAPVDDPNLVVKVFDTGDRGKAEREWNALISLAGSGLAPEPIHFDAGDRAVVVMTRVSGSPLPAGALGREHARVIGSVHRVVHRAATTPLRPVTHLGLRAAQDTLMLDGSDETPIDSDDVSGIVSRSWRAARTWIANAEVPPRPPPKVLCFTRGDPNLSNYLWTGDGLVLVDWEDSGHNDPALELADMAEHPSTRMLGEAFWIDLADATELTQPDRGRVVDARRLMACFWLVIIRQRQLQGLPTTVNLDEQAHRTLAVLDC